MKSDEDGLKTKKEEKRREEKRREEKRREEKGREATHKQSIICFKTYGFDQQS